MNTSSTDKIDTRIIDAVNKHCAIFPNEYIEGCTRNDFIDCVNEMKLHNGMYNYMLYSLWVKREKMTVNEMFNFLDNMYPVSNYRRAMLKGGIQAQIDKGRFLQRDKWAVLGMFGINENDVLPCEDIH